MTLGEYLGVETIEEMLENMTMGEYMRMIRAAAKGDEELRKAVNSILAHRTKVAAAQTPQEAQELMREPYPDISAIDPELQQAIKEAIDRCGGLEGFKVQLEAKQAEFEKKLNEKTQGMRDKERQLLIDFTRGQELLGGEYAEIFGKIHEAIEAAIAFTQSETYKTITATAAALAKYAAEHKEELQLMAEGARQLLELTPFIEAEIKAQMAAHPEYAELSTDEVLAGGFYEDGTPIEDNPFQQVIDGAIKRQEEYREGAAIVADIDRIIAHPVESLLYPLDKPNSKIWNMLEAAAPGGQIQLAIDTRRKGTKQEAPILYALSFPDLVDGIQITRQLTPFDKRCYVAAAALYNEGNEYMTATQIHRAMGNSSSPSPAQVDKINESITKMGAARVYIDNAREIEVNKKYAAFKYDAALLPFERVRKYINGTLSESAIHLFREPPLITFARERQQITTIERQLLESPISKTDGNLRLEDYLLERIGHMKNGAAGTPRKMLYATIYEHCAIKTKMQRERAPGKIRQYLNHYKKCGWIKDYTESKEGVTIHL